MSQVEIKFDSNRPECEVILGASRRVVRTSRRLLGGVLLGASGEAERAIESTLIWTDMLSRGGVAVGVGGGRLVILGLIQSSRRAVSYIERVEDRHGVRTYVPHPLEITFPTILMGLVLDNGRFLRGGVWVPLPAALPTISVTGEAPVLTHFPWGNIYANGMMCWGQVSPADIRSLTDMEKLFFESGFNADLVSAIPLSDAPGGILPPLTNAALFTTTMPAAIRKLVGE